MLILLYLIVGCFIKPVDLWRNLRLPLYVQFHASVTVGIFFKKIETTHRSTFNDTENLTKKEDYTNEIDMDEDMHDEEDGCRSCKDDIDNEIMEMNMSVILRAQNNLKDLYDILFYSLLRMGLSEKEARFIFQQSEKEARFTFQQIITTKERQSAVDVLDELMFASDFNTIYDECLSQKTFIDAMEIFYTSDYTRAVMSDFAKGLFRTIRSMDLSETAFMHAFTTAYAVKGNQTIEQYVPSEVVLVELTHVLRTLGLSNDIMAPLQSIYMYYSDLNVAAASKYLVVVLFNYFLGLDLSRGEIQNACKKTLRTIEAAVDSLIVTLSNIFRASSWSEKDVTDTLALSFQEENNQKNEITVTLARFSDDLYESFREAIPSDEFTIINNNSSTNTTAKTEKVEAAIKLLVIELFFDIPTASQFGGKKYRIRVYYDDEDIGAEDFQPAVTRLAMLIFHIYQAQRMPQPPSRIRRNKN